MPHQRTLSIDLCVEQIGTTVWCGFVRGELAEGAGEGRGDVDVLGRAEKLEQHEQEVVDDEEEDEEGAAQPAGAHQIAQVLFEGASRLLRDPLVHLLRALRNVWPRVQIFDARVHVEGFCDGFNQGFRLARSFALLVWLLNKKKSPEFLSLSTSTTISSKFFVRDKIETSWPEKDCSNV